jgi:hypothetical protein
MLSRFPRSQRVDVVLRTNLVVLRTNAEKFTPDPDNDTLELTRKLAPADVRYHIRFVEKAIPTNCQSPAEKELIPTPENGGGTTKQLSARPPILRTGVFYSPVHCTARSSGSALHHPSTTDSGALHCPQFRQCVAPLPNQNPQTPRGAGHSPARTMVAPRDRRVTTLPRPSSITTWTRVFFVEQIGNLFNKRRIS